MLLHLARLEEAGTQKEEPLAFRGRPSACLQLEQDKYGRVGGSTKPDTGDHYYPGQTTATGYESMLDYYLKVAPQLNEPPPDRTGRAVHVTRSYSGGRGAPHRLQAVRPPTRLWAGFRRSTCYRNFYKGFFFLSTVGCG